MTEHDTTRLAQLGRQRRKLLRDLADNRTEIVPLVVEAIAAGVRQARVVELSGFTREAIRIICRKATGQPIKARPGKGRTKKVER